MIGTIIGVVFCHNIVAVQHFIENVTGGRVFDASVFMLTELPNTHRLGRCRAGGRARAGAVAAGHAVSKLARGADRSGGGAAP